MLHKTRPNLQALVFLSCVVLLVGVRLVFIGVNERSLTVDEAQYWSWSLHLTWGYHSKPPLIAWLIAGFRHLWGQEPWALRAPMALAYGAAAYAVRGAAQYLCHNKRVTLWAGLTFLSLPAISFSSTLLSTDPWYLLAWSGALYCTVRAWRTPHWVWWCALGVCIGLGALVKYTALVFIPCLLGWGLMTGELKAVWRHSGFWLALAIALGLLTPNIAWNMQHHWASLHHVAHENIGLQEAYLHPWKLLGFWCAQFGVFGPITMATLMWTWLRRWRPMPASPEVRLLWVMTIPWFIVISVEGLLVHAYAHWAAPCYVAGSIALSKALSEVNAWQWLRRSFILHLVLMGLWMGIEYAGHALPTGGLLKRLHSARVAAPGWPKLGRQIGDLLASYPNTLLLTDTRGVMVKSLYYGKLAWSQVYMWNPLYLQDKARAMEGDYDTQHPLRRDSMQRFLFVTDNRDPACRVWKHFKEHRNLKDLVLDLGGGRTHKLSVYLLQGFTGYVAKLSRECLAR